MSSYPSTMEPPAVPPSEDLVSSADLRAAAAAQRSGAARRMLAGFGCIVLAVGLAALAVASSRWTGGIFVVALAPLGWSFREFDAAKLRRRRATHYQRTADAWASSSTVAPLSTVDAEFTRQRRAVAEGASDGVPRSVVLAGGLFVACGGLYYFAVLWER